MTSIDEAIKYAEGDLLALYRLNSRLPNALPTSSVARIESLTRNKNVATLMIISEIMTIESTKRRVNTKKIIAWHRLQYLRKKRLLFIEEMKNGQLYGIPEQR
jgi:hypothetical protein